MIEKIEGMQVGENTYGMTGDQAKINEIIDKVNDLEQIIYDFTGHIKP